MKIKIITTLTLCFAACAAMASPPRTLESGIKLPAVWPPRYEEPTVAGDMIVPYLIEKPEVISINVGRQLFVDNFLISTTDMESVTHKPTFYSSNPVLEPDKEWEKTVEGALYASPFSDGIWFDETDNKFKMWYMAGAGMLHKQDNQTFYTCYAESEDGKLWKKVNTDVHEGTNIVETQNRDAATIWLDKQEVDPAKRFKMFSVQRRPTDRRWQMLLKYSADGIHWTDVAQSGDMYDRSTAFYNPFLETWALSTRYGTAVSSRSRGYAQHADPELLVSVAHRTMKSSPDKFMHYWFTPSDKEPRHPKYPEVEPGIYNFDCIPYESIMLGQYNVWQGPENNICAKDSIQKKNEIFLGYSRDGFHYHRGSFEPFMAVNESDGAWNWGNMQSINGVPLIVGDSLYFYSSGRRLSKVMWDSHTSTGLATLRRDGFVSMQSGKKEATLVTEPLQFDGKYLFVNADIKGKLSVEVLDVDGNPISGYTRKELSAIKKQNGTKIEFADLSALAGKVVRLKFSSTNTDLYAFWVSPWKSGQSRGYTGGGGPGLSPDGVDKPLK